MAKLVLLDDPTLGKREKAEIERRFERLVELTTAPMTKPTRVYFISVKGTDFVKIGMADHVPSRLASLQAANPHELVCLGVIDCGAHARAREAELHQRFSGSWVRGEWFRLTEDIEWYIRGYCGRMTNDASEDVRRPKIPKGAKVPRGTSAKDRMARYCIARGLER